MRKGFSLNFNGEATAATRPILARSPQTNRQMYSPEEIKFPRPPTGKLYESTPNLSFFLSSLLPPFFSKSRESQQIPRHFSCSFLRQFFDTVYQRDISLEGFDFFGSKCALHFSWDRKSIVFLSRREMKRNSRAFQ